MTRSTRLGQFPATFCPPVCALYFYSGQLFPIKHQATLNIKALLSIKTKAPAFEQDIHNQAAISSVYLQHSWCSVCGVFFYMTSRNVAAKKRFFIFNQTN